MPSITNGYVAEDDIRASLQLTISGYDDAIRSFINDASREIDSHCGRRFWPDTNATARVFYPSTGHWCPVDDAWEITSVQTDTVGDLSWATTWATTDYQTEPVNGCVNGVEGWPVTGLRTRDRGTQTFYDYRRSASVQITAKWGWASIPPPVATACRILTKAVMAQDQSPSGMIGESSFGEIRLPRDQLNLVSSKLAPYVRLGGTGLPGIA